MIRLEIQELEAHVRDLLRQAHERGETVELLDKGELISRVVPVEDPPIDPEESRKAWENLDRVAAEISAHWPEGVSALDAINDVRREL
jgi:antitoxin (DNA-binding transcriptional repressor) of toxin-antitoxin stability system